MTPDDVSPSDFARLIGRYQVTRDRYWLTRHYVAASTLVTFAIAAAAPGSLNARAVTAAGDLGWIALACLALVSLAALFEAFVTAFGGKYSCEWLRRRRHTLYMTVAIGQLSLGYAVVAYAPESRLLLLRFALDATVAAVVAFLDLFARHKAAHAA